MASPASPCDQPRANLVDRDVEQTTTPRLYEGGQKENLLPRGLELLEQQEFMNIELVFYGVQRGQTAHRDKGPMLLGKRMRWGTFCGIAETIDGLTA
jgi:hypothetical protein